LSSHGRHTHPPPPPSKVPQQLMSGVLDVLQRLRSPTLNLCMILDSISFQSMTNVL
jgi:hypothetical protein